MQTKVFKEINKCSAINVCDLGGKKSVVDLHFFIEYRVSVQHK